VKPFSRKNRPFYGQNICLRNLLKKDANRKYLAWLKDPDVNKFMAKGLPSTLRELQKYRRTINESGRDMIFAVVVKKSGKHIGNSTLQEIDRCKKTAVFGILIGDTGEWGKGYGKEATALTLRYGFDCLGLEEIRLGVYSAHIPAIELYKRSGFKINKKTPEKVFMNIKKERFKRLEGL